MGMLSNKKLQFTNKCHLNLLFLVLDYYKNVSTTIGWEVFILEEVKKIEKKILWLLQILMLYFHFLTTEH